MAFNSVGVLYTSEQYDFGLWQTQLIAINFIWCEHIQNKQCTEFMKLIVSHLRHIHSMS